MSYGPRPIVKKIATGEYSTITTPSGIVETLWFGNDGEVRTVGRTRLPSLEAIAAEHIAEDNERRIRAEREATREVSA